MAGRSHNSPGYSSRASSWRAYRPGTLRASRAWRARRRLEAPQAPADPRSARCRGLSRAMRPRSRGLRGGRATRRPRRLRRNPRRACARSSASAIAPSASAASAPGSKLSRIDKSSEVSAAPPIVSSQRKKNIVGRPFASTIAICGVRPACVPSCGVPIGGWRVLLMLSSPRARLHLDLRGKDYPVAWIGDGDLRYPRAPAAELVVYNLCLGIPDRAGWRRHLV